MKNKKLIYIIIRILIVILIFSVLDFDFDKIKSALSDGATQMILILTLLFVFLQYLQKKK